MSDLGSIFVNTLLNLSHVDIFQYFVVSVGIFGVVLLVRKIIFA